ncbi:hypothetical protein XENORESO_010115 [Xenotaenia resolanae]|uniref:Uncharacterized protein n=1 Tax=Xenotaenia resolanae TaxID=208358 RepID=A0ABV0WQT4_9TELE
MLECCANHPIRKLLYHQRSFSDDSRRSNPREERPRTGRPGLLVGENMLSLCLILAFFTHSSGQLSHVQQYEVVRPQRRPERRTRSLQDNQVRTLDLFIVLVVEL